MMAQAADPALAVKRVIKGQSCESEGKHVALVLELVGFVVISSGMDFPEFDLYIVGHACGVVHVLLLMVWKLKQWF